MFHRAQKTSVMIVLNGVVNDSRVKKSAASLISHGYDTKIFGLGNRQDKEVKKIELEGGVEVLLLLHVVDLRGERVHHLLRQRGARPEQIA